MVDPESRFAEFKAFLEQRDGFFRVPLVLVKQRQVTDRAERVSVIPTKLFSPRRNKRFVQCDGRFGLARNPIRRARVYLATAGALRIHPRTKDD